MNASNSVIKKAIIVCATGFVVFLGLFILLYTGILQVNYPDKMKFPVRGIDISHHQQTIDWELLKQEDINFIFIKATEGGDFKDSLFLENWNNAKKGGFIRGAYHFFTFCRAGKEQAQNFIETVPVESGTLPPVIDLEFGGNCSRTPEKEVLAKELKDFIGEIEKVYQQPPIFYTTYDVYDTYLIEDFGDYRLWIRDICLYPQLPKNESWMFWQYSIRGRIKGIPTYVDLNVFYANDEVFKQMIKP